MVKKGPLIHCLHFMPSNWFHKDLTLTWSFRSNSAPITAVTKSIHFVLSPYHAWFYNLSYSVFLTPIFSVTKMPKIRFRISSRLSIASSKAIVEKEQCKWRNNLYHMSYLARRNLCVCVNHLSTAVQHEENVLIFFPKGKSSWRNQSASFPGGKTFSFMCSNFCMLCLPWENGSLDCEFK